MSRTERLGLLVLSAVGAFILALAIHKATGEPRNLPGRSPRPDPSPWHRENFEADAPSDGVSEVWNSGAGGASHNSADVRGSESPTPADSAPAIDDGSEPAFGWGHIVGLVLAQDYVKTRSSRSERPPAVEDRVEFLSWLNRREPRPVGPSGRTDLQGLAFLQGERFRWFPGREASLRLHASLAVPGYAQRLGVDLEGERLEDIVKFWEDWMIRQKSLEDAILLKAIALVENGHPALGPETGVMAFHLDDGSLSTVRLGEDPEVDRLMDELSRHDSETEYELRFRIQEWLR